MQNADFGGTHLPLSDAQPESSDYGTWLQPEKCDACPIAARTAAAIGDTARDNLITLPCNSSAGAVRRVRIGIRYGQR